MTIDPVDAARMFRVACLFVSMAWTFDLVPPTGVRIGLIVLFAAAVVADQWLTQQQPTRTMRIPTARTKTAA